MRARGRFQESAQWLRVLETMPLRNLLRTLPKVPATTGRVLGLGQD